MTFTQPYMHPFVVRNIGTYESDREYLYQSPFQKVSGFSSMSEPIRPHENDVLMGRGGKNNQHTGNEKLREMARLESDNYRKSSKKGKSYISRQLVNQVRSLNPPGRFLKRDTETGEWEDVGDDVAREKASQVLRDAVALLPEDNDTTPLPVDVSSYPTNLSSVPVSVDEAERARSVYSQRPTPVLPHSGSQLPIPTPVVPTPVTSYRKRRRQHYYGYEGYQPEEVHSPIPTPSRRRYAHQHNYHYHLPPPPSIHSSEPRYDHYYESYAGSTGPLEPTLPLSHSEFTHRQQTNRPPAVSARQASTASAGSLLGELQSGMNEFDLFNGELIESDHEEAKRSRASPRNNP